MYMGFKFEEVFNNNMMVIPACLTTVHQDPHVSSY